MAGEPVVFMEQMVDLSYRVVAPPLQQRFDEHMRAARITGHRCPSCGLVYSPPKGFCPMCVVETGEPDEVTVADRGTVTSFTVITPVQYRGQREHEPYVLASILLDGADSPVGQQRIGEVPADRVRTGMRVEAVWRPVADRGRDASGGRYGLGEAIAHWTPTGEPDAAAESYQEHVL